MSKNKKKSRKRACTKVELYVLKWAREKRVFVGRLREFMCVCMRTCMQKVSVRVRKRC